MGSWLVVHIVRTNDSPFAIKCERARALARSRQSIHNALLNDIDCSNTFDAYALSERFVALSCACVCVCVRFFIHPFHSIPISFIRLNGNHFFLCLFILLDELKVLMLLYICKIHHRNGADYVPMEKKIM